MHKVMLQGEVQKMTANELFVFQNLAAVYKLRDRGISQVNWNVQQNEESNSTSRKTRFIFLHFVSTKALIL